MTSKNPAVAIMKTLIGSLPDEELMELAKSPDDMELKKLPTLQKLLGIEEEKT